MYSQCQHFDLITSSLTHRFKQKLSGICFKRKARGKDLLQVSVAAITSHKIFIEAKLGS